MQVSAASWKRQGSGFSPQSPREHQPYWYLGFNPVSLDFGILIFRTLRYLLSGFEPLDFGELLQRSQELIQWSACHDKWNRRANASLVSVHTRVHIHTHTNIYAYCMCALDCRILRGIPSCSLWEGGHCLLGCCWMDRPCPLSCANSLGSAHSPGQLSWQVHLAFPNP